MNQTVELGQVRSSRLAKAGDLSSAVGFNIKLNDCDTNVSNNAAVAFLGTTVTSNDDTEPTFITNALSLETRRLANVLATFTDCLM